MKCLLGYVTVVLVPAMLVLSGCRSGLSKAELQKVIDGSTKFSPAPIDLAVVGPSLQAGLKQQCWTQRYDGGILLTDKGNRIFSSCVGRIRGSRMIFFATPEKLIKRHVAEVTSVIDAAHGENPDAEKIVDFTWQWNLDGLPQDVRDCLSIKGSPVVGSDGEAVMKLDKDGWHVEKYEDHTP